MADTDPVTPRLRVLTMNVYGPANPDWERRSRLLATTIRTLDPDIVALQEVPVTRDVLDQLVGALPHRPHFSQPSVDGFSVCYQDAWEFDRPNDPGHTFDLENPLVRDGEVATAVSRKIDHILVRGGLRGPSLRGADCRRILDGPVDGVWASDHYGVLADLALPRNPPGFRS